MADYFKGLFANCIIAAIIILSIGNNLYVWHNNTAYYNETGGSGHNSDAIYRLADWLEGNGNLKPVIVDWGFIDCIRLLTKNRITPVDFQCEVDQFNIREYSARKDKINYYTERWQNTFNDKNSIFVTFAGSDNESDRLFYAISERLCLKPTVIKQFYTRDNRLIYNIYGLNRSNILPKLPAAKT